MWGCGGRLTFDLQAHLVLSRAQDAVGHAGVGALVLGLGPFDLQGPVEVDAVLATVQPAALAVLEPARDGTEKKVVNISICSLDFLSPHEEPLAFPWFIIG